MKLKNKTYDILKWVDLTFIPALIVFLGVIFSALHYDGQVVLTILGGFDVFLGSLLGISSNRYKNDLVVEVKEKEV